MMKIIDLTISYVPGLGHPMFRKFQIAPFHVHEIHKRYNADISMAIHIGTHIDAPYHFFVDGTTVDMVPLNQLIGEGVLFRVEGLAAPKHRFTIEDLKANAKGHGSNLRGKIAVMATGWSNRTFSDESYYFSNSPSLSPEAAEWLVESGVKAVVLDSATDAAEPVPVPEQTCLVHRTFLKKGVIIVENCIDTIRIPDDRSITVYAIPLKIRSESGAPARVFATVED